jgi:hypothetical protein
MRILLIGLLLVGCTTNHVKLTCNIGDVYPDYTYEALSDGIGPELACAEKSIQLRAKQYTVISIKGVCVYRDGSTGQVYLLEGLKLRYEQGCFK